LRYSRCNDGEFCVQFVKPSQRAAVRGLPRYKTRCQSRTNRLLLAIATNCCRDSSRMSLCQFISGPTPSVTSRIASICAVTIGQRLTADCPSLCTTSIRRRLSDAGGNDPMPWQAYSWKTIIPVARCFHAIAPLPDLLPVRAAISDRSCTTEVIRRRKGRRGRMGVPDKLYQQAIAMANASRCSVHKDPFQEVTTVNSQVAVGRNLGTYLPTETA
jgi:hypothetical protein